MFSGSVIFFVYRISCFPEEALIKQNKVKLLTIKLKYVCKDIQSSTNRKRTTDRKIQVKYLLLRTSLNYNFFTFDYCLIKELIKRVILLVSVLIRRHTKITSQVTYKPIIRLENFALGQRFTER